MTLAPLAQRAHDRQEAHGLPDDIGGLVAMLLAPDTQWLTGQRIEVTGGFML